MRVFLYSLLNKHIPPRPAQGQAPPDKALQPITLCLKTDVL